MAQATRLTVRTLHHWEGLGLVIASERAAAGHRRYSSRHLARLHAVVTLRGIGLPLPETRAPLEAVQRLAARWKGLIQAFTGGDPGIAASLQRMYDEQGPPEASRGAVSRELMEYVGRALAAMEDGGVSRR